MAAYPIIVPTVWPRIFAAMCGGSPLRRASVANSLRKSWGENDSGARAASVSPETARVWLRNRRRVPASRAAWRGPRGRWNSSGHGVVPDPFVPVVAAHQRQDRLPAADAVDELGEDLTQLGCDE